MLQLTLSCTHLMFQNKFTALKRQHEKLQMDMMQTQLWQAESVDDSLEEKEGEKQ